MLAALLILGSAVSACSDDTSPDDEVAIRIRLSEDFVDITVPGDVTIDEAVFLFSNEKGIDYELAVVEVVQEATWEGFLALGRSNPVEAREFDIFGLIIQQDAESATLREALDPERSGLAIVVSETGAIAPLISFAELFPIDLHVTVSTRFSLDAVRIVSPFESSSSQTNSHGI